MNRTRLISRVAALVVAGATALLSASPLAFAADDAAVPQQTPAGAAHSPQLTAADVSAWLDGFMPYALQQGDIAGAVVAVVKDGQVLFAKGYGYADVATNQPMDAERTLVRPGSVSKLFTWTAVMQLVQQGKIDLDADVNTYLDFKIPPFDGQPVTMRNIMTHTAGFEEAIKGLIGKEGDPVPTLEEYLKRWTPTRIYAPGATPAYSNWATTLAGYIVQRVSGMPFDDYLDAHIFEPLGMTSSTFRQPPPDALKARMAKGYKAAPLPVEAFEIVPAAPAGSLSSTASDMARFMIAHLQNGRYGDVEILAPATAEQMHTTALTLQPKVNRMLLGFYEDNRNGHRVIAHGGDTQWFHSDLHLYVDDGVGLFVSVNSPGNEGAAHNLRGALFDEFTDRYFPPSGASQTSVDAKLAQEHARIIARNYWDSRRADRNFLSLLNLAGELKVIDNGDGTVGISMLKSPIGVPFRWREIEPFLWQNEHDASLLSARVTDGRVTRIAFGVFAPFMVFEPPPWWKSGAWLLPAAVSALAILLLASIAWPVSALTRRYFRAKPALEGIDARARRWARIAAVASFLTWAAWMTTITVMMSDFSWLSSKTDPWLWVLKVASIVTFVGGALAGAWNARVTLRSRRRWYAKAWAVLLALALLVSLWVAVAFHVLTPSVNY